MEFIKITDAQSDYSTKIFASYSTTFPEDERRSLEQFQLLFKNKNIEITALFLNENFVGYAIIWQLSGFNFMEHFEVFSEFRNQKLGSFVIQNISKKYPKLILESEPENLNEDAKRRINFYERNNFQILDKNYLQPAYSDGKNQLELWLMGNYLPENLDSVKGNIIKVVYQ
jgi:ribosomal protein S18 acetylase RimI-like enzyme